MRRQLSPSQRAVERIGMFTNPFDVVHCRPLAKQQGAPLYQSLEDSVTKLIDGACKTRVRRSWHHSAGLGFGAAAAAAAFFSTKRTDQTDPS